MKFTFQKLQEDRFKVAKIFSSVHWFYITSCYVMLNVMNIFVHVEHECIACNSSSNIPQYSFMNYNNHCVVVQSCRKSFKKLVFVLNHRQCYWWVEYIKLLLSYCNGCFRYLRSIYYLNVISGNTIILLNITLMNYYQIRNFWCYWIWKTMKDDCMDQKTEWFNFNESWIQKRHIDQFSKFLTSKNNWILLLKEIFVLLK